MAFGLSLHRWPQLIPSPVKDIDIAVVVMNIALRIPGTTSSTACSSVVVLKGELAELGMRKDEL